ncbi:MAG: hypothetical protein NVS3B24_23730 [Candidatus Dormibacteria bacterium]
MLHNVVRFYVGAVFLTGLATAAYTLRFLTGGQVVPILVFCVAAALMERVRVMVAADSFAISLSLAVVLAAAVATGPAGAALAALSAGLGTLVGRNRAPISKALFNAGLFSGAGGLAAVAYTVVGGGLDAGGHWSLRTATGGAVALIAYFAVACPALVGILHLTTGKGLRQLWDDLRWMPVQIAVSAALGFTLGTAYVLFGWVGAAVYVAPLLGLREAMRQYTKRVAAQVQELQQAHSEADAANQKLIEVNAALDVTNEGLLKTLASVIDARDIYLYGHSVQASKYAGQVARMMNLSVEQTRIAELGALLHDLGKIGVSEAILNKPARLTEAEYVEVKSHCEIGYHLLSNLPHFEEVAEIVYSHHEHYDGTGYPRRLKGDQIHIGARIVSVVEATEAMVSDRPYRRGMTPDEVLQELADGAGSQWDPAVVSVFSAMLSQDRKHLSMRNSALEIALSRTPMGQLVQATDAPSLQGMTATVRGAGQPILILGEDYRVVAANPAAERVMGCSEAQLQEHTWGELTGSAELRIETGQRYFSSTRVVEFRPASGDPVKLEVTASQIETNSASYWVVLGNPVPLRAAAEPAPAREPLTGLANLEELRAAAEAAIDGGGAPMTLALMNIDGLRSINETFGKEVGDDALRTLAGVLRQQLRQGDVAARVGADTFALLMRRATITDAGRTLQRVEDEFPGAAAAAAIECIIEFCSGAAQWNGQESFVELMARARLWLEAEKRSRKPGAVVALPLTRARRRGLVGAGETADGGLG